MQLLRQVNKQLNVNDLYVRLMQCGSPYGNGRYTTPIDQDMVPFEEYVAGVAYAEVGPSANMEVLKGVLEIAASTYNTTVLNLLLLVAIVIFLEIVYALLIGYVGIILGHKSNKNKMLRSIVIGFVLYFVFQTLTLGLIAIFGLFNSDVMNLINTTDIVNVEAIKSVMYAGIGIYVVYAIFGVARLAYFNINAPKDNKPVKYYEGLPVTSVALILPLLFPIISRFETAASILFTALFLVIAFFFIFKFKVPKFKLKGMSVLVAIGIVIYILMLLRNVIYRF